MPKISVIVPIYKTKEAYLRKCIDSVIAQTLGDIEVILIDDGSPDNCGAICDEYKKIDPRITVIHQENRGLAFVRNLGISTASTNWIMHVDSDDWLEPSMCDELYQFALKNDSDIVCCASYAEHLKFQKEQSVFLKTIDKLTQKQKEELQLKTMILQCPLFENPVSGQVYASSSWGKLYKKEFISNNHLFFNTTNKRTEYQEFSLVAFENAVGISFLYESLYHYRCYDSVTSTGYFPNVTQLYENILLGTDNFIKDNKKPEIFNSAHTIQWLYFVFNAISGDFFHAKNPNTVWQKIKSVGDYLGTTENQKRMDCINTQLLDKASYKKYWLLKHKFYLAYFCLFSLRKKGGGL